MGTIAKEVAKRLRTALDEDRSRFERDEAEKREAIEAIARTAEADAIAVAAAEAEDEERRLVAAWQRRINRDDQYQPAPEGVTDEEVEARRIELGIPLNALRCDDGSIGFGAVVCDLWAKRNEANARQVEAERAAERAAVMQRAVDRQLEWEARQADIAKMER